MRLYNLTTLLAALFCVVKAGEAAVDLSVKDQHDLRDAVLETEGVSPVSQAGCIGNLLHPLAPHTPGGKIYGRAIGDRCGPVTGAKYACLLLINVVSSHR
jgi:hypothetical protein